MEPQPIFVLGAPRSGTTLIGHYLESCPSICHLGEFSGFFLTYYIVPKEYVRVPTPYKERYIEELQRNAHEFASKVATERGFRYYCDSTPWTILVAREL